MFCLPKTAWPPTYFEVRVSIPVKDQILRVAVDSWIPAFAGMTEGAGAQVRHAGESRHPGVVPKTTSIVSSWRSWFSLHVPA